MEKVTNTQNYNFDIEVGLTMMLLKLGYFTGAWK